MFIFDVVFHEVIFHDKLYYKLKIKEQISCIKKFKFKFFNKMFAKFIWNPFIRA